MILTLTVNPTVDIGTGTRRVVSTHKMRCDPPRRDPGGGGVNAARVISDLGGEACAAFTVGGAIGQALESFLVETGIACRPLPIAEETRISFTVAETDTGEEYRFVMPGPHLAESEWQSCLDAVAGHDDPTPRVVLASGSLPPGVPDDFYAQVAATARARGIFCAIDASGKPLAAALEGGVSLVKPNLRELSEYLGRDLTEPGDQEAAVSRLIEKGAAEVIALTLGADGALLATRDGVLRVASPEVEPRSAVGAGDSFLGAMCLRIAEDWPIEDAFRYGVAAGAAALLTSGTELCRHGDVERLYEDMKAAS